MNTVWEFWEIYYGINSKKKVLPLSMSVERRHVLFWFLAGTTVHHDWLLSGNMHGPRHKPGTRTHTKKIIYICLFINVYNPYLACTEKYLAFTYRANPAKTHPSSLTRLYTLGWTTLNSHIDTHKIDNMRNQFKGKKAATCKWKWVL